MRTSGALASFDQILEFAAIRTDADFQEVERFDAHSRVLPHIVPSPSALFAARIAVPRLNNSLLPSHYGMVRSIRAKLMAWSPSTFVGFNSLSLDEHFLRQSLYQTLHPPYLTNCDGNTRADVAKVIQASLLFAPAALIIPRGSDGQLEIDLCSVASANGLIYDKTCNAINAVEAIINLAEKLNEKAPDLWSTAMRFSKKAAVVDFIENELVFSLSDFFYGKSQSWLVTLIGANGTNSSERYVFNLGVDPDGLAALSDDGLRSRLAETPKPVRILRINAAPILTAEADAPANASGRKLDTAELERRAESLQSDEAFSERLVRAFEEIQEPKALSSHVEEQIYDGFASDEDIDLMERFHAVPWEKRSAIVSQFNDARLKRLGRRLIHFENPKALDATVRQQHDRAVAKRLLGTDGESPWLTLPKAMAEIRQLLATASPKDITLLRDHHTFLARTIQRAKALIALPV